VLTAQTLVAGRYRLLRRLGAGAMGAVYEALDLETERSRAVKVMHAHTLDRADLRQRFRFEAKVTGRVQSPFLVDVLDAGVAEDGTPFLVMELLRGEDLRRRLDRVGRFSPEEALGYAEQTALALDRVHAAGIVHRDLKPGNLFLEEREYELPRVKVLDFGIAKLIEDTRSSESTSSAGTPVYMAPEQFRGRGITKAVDVYALGMIAFSFLVGAVYWEDEQGEGGDIVQLALVVVEGPKEPASVRAARRGVELPAAFDAWFARATATDPSARFASAGRAARMLVDALEVSSMHPELDVLQEAAPAPPEALLRAPDVDASDTTAPSSPIPSGERADCDGPGRGTTAQPRARAARLVAAPRSPIAASVPFELENHVGRLVETRPRALRTPDDVAAFGAAMRDVTSRVAGSIVICGDFRWTKVVSQSTADAFIAMFAVFNPRVERSGVLLSPENATLNLQIERLVREAGNPSRRTFRAVPTLIAWLGEVLISAERARLAEFLSMG
jgi:serine/threonine-protein kinase